MAAAAAGAAGRAAGKAAGKAIERLTAEARVTLEGELDGPGRKLWDWLKRGGRAAVPRERSEFDVLKKMWNDSEMQAYRAILRSEDQLRLAADGIVLRQLQDRPAAVDKHRRRIHRYGGPEGLRFAQAVQMGVLRYLMDHLDQRGFTDEYKMNHVKSFFLNITRHVRFVESSEDEDRVYSDVDLMMSLRPLIFFVAGAGLAAKTAAAVGQRIYEDHNGYSRGITEERGRAVFKLCLEEDGWIPPEVLERRGRNILGKVVTPKPKIRQK